MHIPFSSYKPAVPVNSKIIFFKPAEKIPFDDLMGKPIPAWKPFARRGLEVHEAPGNHFNMISPVNAPVLVKMMKEWNKRGQYPFLVTKIIND
jgi:thioesterase domain-containing protein